MAKCPVCDIRKGKRKCARVNNAFICSLCCANMREEELCGECVFYQPPHYDYEKVPAFSIIALENNHALQNYQHLIENAIAAQTVQDLLAIIELLLIKYHFKEAEVKLQQSKWEIGFKAAVNLIESKLAEFDEDIVINLLGAMRHAALNKIALETSTLEKGESL